MKRYLVIAALLLPSGLASAQSLDLPLSAYGILNNSVANLHVDGDRLWIGPFLNVTDDGAATIYRAQTDSLFGTANRLFSIDTDGDIVVAGLGTSDASGGQAVQTAAGFLVSEDGGQTFAYRFPQLDNPGDDTQVYGVNTLEALPVIVPQQSPPFDVSVADGTLWVAGWASGIRRSQDLGRTWSRVVLPPDNLDYISPDSTYSFVLEPQRGSEGSLNHMGFSVLVASTGTIWAGTAGGLNRSTDDGLTWQRFKTPALTGNWVISIEEQILPGSSVIWAATWNTGDVGGGGGGQFGVSLTRDGGTTFERTLLGQRVYDFAFDGSRVYAAGDNGLFMTDNDGRTWTSTTDFRDATDPSRLVRPGSSVFTVEVDDAGRLWVGTSDGLLRSVDGGLSWRLYRTDVPLDPEVDNVRAPRVETFAYPNPFSPGSDRFIRIKLDVPQGGEARLSIFDYSMNVVRTVTSPVSTGVNEILWDGLDDRGARVANGAYFYDVEAGGQQVRGKILVIE